MENKKNLLVTLADKNFIDQAKQLFSSVYWNAGWKGDYMLLSHEIPEKDLKWFSDRGILIKKCKPLYDKNIEKRKDPPTLLDKFYLFTSEFKKWKKIVYLDADIIVRASLDELTKVSDFSAIKDGLGHSNLKHQIIKEKREIIGQKYDLKQKSFNSGVMVFSSDIINEGDFDVLKKLFQHYMSSSRFAEQLFLNLFLYKKWHNLPLQYNIWPFFIYVNYKPSLKSIRGIIIHFVKIDNNNYYRPWNKKNPFYNEWKNNLERAELIDLNNIPDGKKINRIKLFFSLILPKIVISLNSESFLEIKNKLHNKIHLFFHLPEKFLGRFGIFLKEYNCSLYYKLKKMEKEIKKWKRD